MSIQKGSLTLFKHHILVTGRILLLYLEKKLTTDATPKDPQYYTRPIDEKTYATAGTMQEVRSMLLKSMGVQYGQHQSDNQEDRSGLSKYIVSREELPKRTVSDSFVSAIIPISTQKILQDRYQMIGDKVHLGKLLEAMDLFAVYIVHTYIKNPMVPEGTVFPYNIVTVLVDRIEFTDYVPVITKDIRISGHVSWVGTSSVEVVVWLEQPVDGKLHRITRALFLMAVRDYYSTKAAPINILEATNDREKRLLDGGKLRQKQRRSQSQNVLTKVIPTTDEQNVMHELFLKTTSSREVQLDKRILPDNSVWMERCTLSSLFIAHTENRNMHFKLFGGYIMLQALESSWCLGYLYTKRRPVLKHISNITFNMPIEINSLVRMQAAVVYTFEKYLQITVYGEVFDINNRQTQTTNAFNFTYKAEEPVEKVYPLTYQETMLFLDGRRHFHKLKSAKLVE